MIYLMTVITMIKLQSIMVISLIRVPAESQSPRDGRLCEDGNQGHPLIIRIIVQTIRCRMIFTK
jgi:hypothetical protein